MIEVDSLKIDLQLKDAELIQIEDRLEAQRNESNLASWVIDNMTAIIEDLSKKNRNLTEEFESYKDSMCALVQQVTDKNGALVRQNRLLEQQVFGSLSFDKMNVIEESVSCSSEHNLNISPIKKCLKRHRCAQKNFVDMN